MYTCMYLFIYLYIYTHICTYINILTSTIYSQGRFWQINPRYSYRVISWWFALNDWCFFDSMWIFVDIRWDGIWYVGLTPQELGVDGDRTVFSKQLLTGRAPPFFSVHLDLFGFSATATSRMTCFDGIWSFSAQMWPVHICDTRIARILCMSTNQSGWSFDLHLSFHPLAAKM